MLWSPVLFGHHLVGGELTYKCLGYDASTDEYNYQLNIVIYNNCNDDIVEALDTTLIIFVIRSDSTHQTLFVDFDSVTFIDTDLINDTCITTPTEACIQKVEYITDVKLKFEGGFYDVTYQRCCRIGSLKNIESPFTTGMTLTAHIPEPQNGSCNSSPVFNQLPPAFLCLDDEFNLDFSATDPDGDQLVYSLCTPLIGGSEDGVIVQLVDPPPYSSITWEASYSASFPFEADPQVALDPVTGFLTGKSLVVGIYCIGICVSEYRDGVLLSETKRDYEVFIYNCLQPISFFAEQNAIQLCDGFEITFENNSLNTDSYLWDFGVETILSDTSIEFEPTFLFPDSGTYEVMLISMPYTNCADTSYQTYFVQQATTVDFNYFGPNCGDIITYSFVPFGTLDEGGDFSWDFGGDIESSEVFPPDINFQENGDHTVTLVYNIDGCFGTVSKNVYVIPEVIAEIAPQLDSCIGLQLYLGNQSQNSSDFIWTIIKDAFQELSSQFEPIVSVPFEGDYSIELIAFEDGACPDTTYIVYNAYPLLSAEFLLDNDTICFDNNSIDFEAGGAFQSSALFFWDFGNNASMGQSTNQNVQDVQFTELGTHLISLTISENICVETFADSVTIYPNPVALFSISDTSGCKPVTVQFYNASSADTPMGFTWSFDDGNFSPLENPIHDYLESGNFSVDLTVTTTFGCVDQVFYQFPLSIDVFPVPVANFDVKPLEVQIESPYVYISNLSLGETALQYIISDFDTIDEENFNYMFDEAGSYNVVQFVQNDFGCLDSLEKTVLVKGFIFYMPNAFTPDGDGFNDVLIPYVGGIEKYQISIFNRWGTVVFQSNSAYEGWDGYNEPQGAYNYVVILYDITGVRYKYTGSIMLLR